jgi:hypothetical protein
LDGDLVTMKLSLGGDATSQTSALGGSREGGLATHNKFEADASLTRADYFTNNGDNYRFQGYLFKQMADECNGSFDRACMTRYRKKRYDASRGMSFGVCTGCLADCTAENDQFLFLPTALLLYGASSFLYELMPGEGGSPNLATISTWFGAVDNGDGTYSHVPERIPEGYRARTTPYSGTDVVTEILAQYLAAPVPFGYVNSVQAMASADCSDSTWVKATSSVLTLPQWASRTANSPQPTRMTLLVSFSRLPWRRYLPPFRDVS